MQNRLYCWYFDRKLKAFALWHLYEEAIFVYLPQFLISWMIRFA